MESNSSIEAENSVAVIIAAYNASATLPRAIKSALAEPEVKEVIVVDDASTDMTVQLARSCDDGKNRLKVLSQSHNHGPSAARNRAIKESKSAWVSILDADDFFLPGRIKGLLAYADKADLIADDLLKVKDDNVDGTRHAMLGDKLKNPHYVSFEEFVLSNVTEAGVERAELGFIKPLMRRRFLKTHNLRYQEAMYLGEDYELYARALAYGASLYLVPAEGYVSVERVHSLSGQHTEHDLRLLRDCDHSLAMIPTLSLRDKKALRRHYLSIDCRLKWRLLIGAVKNRSLRNSLKTFISPFPVPLYLMSKLFEQLHLRTSKKFVERRA